MNYKIGQKIDVPVIRQEANFDRACDSAMRMALSMFGCDEDGHLQYVKGSDRSRDSVEVDFKGLNYGASMGGHQLIYKFTARVVRHNDDGEEDDSDE